MAAWPNSLRLKRRQASGFTLVELLVAMSIALAALGTITYGYIQSYRMTDSSTLQGAAQRLADERLEQVRSAEWKYYSTGENMLTNFQGVVNTTLDLPLLAGSSVAASLTTQVILVTNSSPNPPPLYLIRVVCVWTNLNGEVATNESWTLRGPD